MTGPRRWPALGVWGAALVVAVLVILRTPFSTDMAAFMPTGAGSTQHILADQLRDGVASRLILVGIEHANPETLAAISRKLADDLRHQPAFATVDNGTDSIGKPDQDYIWRNRYLLSPNVTAQRFTAAGLHESLQEDLDLLTSGMAPLAKASLAHDPTGEALAVGQSLAGNLERHISHGVWMSPDDRRALLMIETRARAFDLDGQERDLAAIDAAFAVSARSEPAGAAARLVKTGPAVFGVDTRRQMKHDVTLCSIAATLAIVVLLLAAYRSPRMLVLTLVPVVTGALAGVTAVSLWFGFVHGITIGFGVTLLGESVDYAIYLLAQSEPGEGPRGTLKRIWPTLRLGAAVSICGFAAMLFSRFIGFAQLGVFTISGLAAALLTTRFILPALAPASLMRQGTGRVGPTLLRWMRAAHRLRPLLVIAVIGSLTAIAWQSGHLWQTELSSMNPVPPAAQRRDRDLRRDVGAPDVRYMVMVQAADPETVLETSETAGDILDRLTSRGAIAGYDTPARYLPSAKMQRQRQTALPDPAQLAANLSQALAGLPFQSDAFKPFLADAAAARTAGPLTRASLDGTALSLRLDSLLFKADGHWAAVMPLRGVDNAAAIMAALGPLAAQGVQFVDLKAQSDALLSSYRHEAIMLSLLGGAAIVALLSFHFRAFRPVVSVLLPLGVAVALTLAAVTIGGRQLSIFNLFGLLLVVAVGSNYCLFFQRGGLTGASGERTAISLLLANLCTVIGFGALALSQIPVLFGIGSTVAIGTALSLLAGAILIRPAERS
ncbi:MAG TPA: MMPL family transporter [Stellaceae bacterium]|nr:MMPL family transporter [Stellaceae bacterium]